MEDDGTVHDRGRGKINNLFLFHKTLGRAWQSLGGLRKSGRAMMSHRWTQMSTDTSRKGDVVPRGAVPSAKARRLLTAKCAKHAKGLTQGNVEGQDLRFEIGDFKTEALDGTDAPTAEGLAPEACTFLLNSDNRSLICRHHLTEIKNPQGSYYLEIFIEKKARFSTKRVKGQWVIVNAETIIPRDKEKCWARRGHCIMMSKTSLKSEKLDANT
jgi:hypothetical protein